MRLPCRVCGTKSRRSLSPSRWRYTCAACIARHRAMGQLLPPKPPAPLSKRERQRLEAAQRELYRMKDSGEAYRH